MTPNGKKYFPLGLLFVLVVLLTGYFGVFFLVNSAKPRLEKYLSSNLGMQVKMNSMDVSFLPPSISAKSVDIYKNGSKISNIETLGVNLNLSSLIKGLIQIKDLQLIKPEFVVTRLENGAWNIMLPEHKEIRLLLPQSFNVKDGTIILRDG